MKLFNKLFFHKFIGVFNFVIFISYSWTILVFFYELPSLLLRFSIGEITGFLSYQLMFSLIESVITTVFIVAMIQIIPIKDKTITIGGVVAIGIAIDSLILINISFFDDLYRNSFFANWGPQSYYLISAIWLIVFIYTPVSGILAARSQKISSYIEKISDNLSILATFYTILGIMGAVIVVLRNIF